MPDQYIIREGTQSTHMYILESGNCEVLVKGAISNREVFVRELGGGDVFGETGLLYSTTRTASVKSKEVCTVGALSLEAFNQLIKLYPEIKSRLK